jgi:hypothetical protein
MFKFDFVRDCDNEQTQTAQNAKKETHEPSLTGISLIELVRTPQFTLLVTEGDFLRSWTLCPLSSPTPLYKYHRRRAVLDFLFLDGISLTRDSS